jgi:hypothetical protein
MTDLTINDWVQDLRLNLNRLEGIVDEVERAIADGNLDGAALVLGTQDGKIQRSPSPTTVCTRSSTRRAPTRDGAEAVSLSR